MINTPSYLLLSTTGLSINDGSIKLAKLRPTLFGSAVVLEVTEKVVLPEGVIETGYIQDPEKFKVLLKDLKERHKLSFVHATLPEDRVYLFTALIDKVRDEDVRDAVAFILEENVPLELSQAVFDYDIIGEPEPGKLKVVVSVISKRVVDFYTQVMEEVGITPVSFDVESQAISRATIERGDKATQLIINLGSRKTGFYVIEDEVVQFSTTLPKIDASSLKTEIRKILSFWSARSNTEIKKVLLAGAGATDEEIIKGLKELKTEYPLSFSLANPWQERRELIDFASAIGSALASIKNFKFKLMGEEARARAYREYKNRRWATVLGSLAVCLVVALIGSFPAFATSRAKKLEMDERLEALSTNLTEDAPEIARWVKEANHRLAILAPALDDDRPTRQIAAILSLKPTGIRILNIAWNKDENIFNLSGIASDRQALLEFQTLLNNSQRFEKVEVPLSNLAKDRNAPFSIKLKPTKR